MDSEKIVVGMSGGVDSAVAALLLKRAGYDVLGVFMNNWDERDDEGVCTAARDYDDVKRVCSVIGIPYYSVNLSEQYMHRVFEYFLYEYSRGRTPNPDVLCNREIKFGAFRDFAKGLQAAKIATGHYCEVREDGGKYSLIRAKDENKDQTYFLNQLNQEQLRDAVFPLSGLQKSEVREIARRAGLTVSEKKDSTGICFIGERRFKQFLSGYLPACPGEIVTEEGKVVGRHDGLMYYTKGQRRNMGIGGVRGGEGRFFVVKKDLDGNRLIVSQNESDSLFCKTVITEDFNFIEGTPKNNSFCCTAKFRYRQPDQAVICEVLEQGVRIECAERQRAVTEGQFAVLYDGDRCLGGGVICEVI